MTDIAALLQLGRYGLIGIFLALIALCAFFGWIIWKMSSNHIVHNTDAWNKNTEALTKLTTTIDLKIK